MNNTDPFAAWLEENEVKDLDSISTVADEPAAPATNKAHRADTGRWVRAVWDAADSKLHKCFACHGTGLWSPPIYATRGKTGVCHKCNGAGHFKTSAAERAKAREYRKLTTANKLQSAKDEVLNDHADLIKWLEENKSWNDFARSLMDGEWGFNKRGKLSDKQIAAGRKMMDKMLAKQAEKEAAAKAEVNAAAADTTKSTTIDLSSIPSGYYAVPNGKTRLKVRINRPGKESNWYGWTFVSDGAAYGHGKRYGRQGPGKLYSGDIVEQLQAIAADPREASIAYGKLVEVCGVCGKKLENEKSVAAGIGPICAAKMGW